VVGVLLEQGDDELLAEFRGTLLALVEGDEVAGEGVVEHEVEGGGGLRQEAAAQLRPVGGGGVVHDSNSTVGPVLQEAGPILRRMAGCSYGAAPPA
jgi:hypothetical protein